MIFRFTASLVFYSGLQPFIRHLRDFILDPTKCEEQAVEANVDWCMIHYIFDFDTWLTIFLRNLFFTNPLGTAEDVYGLRSGPFDAWILSLSDGPMFHGACGRHIGAHIPAIRFIVTH